MRRQRGNPVLVLLVGLVMLVLLVYLFSSFLMGSERKARHVVDKFYHYESEGSFSQSWELLHSEMKMRFGRGAYVQDRAHVFNGHFGAETFSYDINDSKEHKSWKMEKDGEAFTDVYEFQVEQTYHGKYGHFLFVQFVYVVREDEEWRILWDFKK
jgi:hypothetical protein